MDRHTNVTVKPVNGITSLPLLIIGSPMATLLHVLINNKRDKYKDNNNK
jgi:hypothetical protein